MKFWCRILVVFLLSACHEPIEKTKPQVERITESVYASGVIKSKDQYYVYASVNGIIKEILVSEGQLVKKGTPIIRVFNKPSALNVSNAQLAADYAKASANKEKLLELQLNINLAKSKMANDSLLWLRQTNLWNQNIGTKLELEQRELNYKNAVTNYRAAIIRYHDFERQLKLNESQAQNNLLINQTLADEYIIKSEVDGRVFDIMREKGEIVNPQSPVALIGNSETYLIELQVDEKDIVRVKVNQRVLISMDSYKNEVFEAEITKINMVMNERSKSFSVEANFVKAPKHLYPFLTAEGNIIIARKENVLTIPRAYLIDDSLVLLENNEKRKVAVGLKDYQKAEILNGLGRDEYILKPKN